MKNLLAIVLGILFSFLLVEIILRLYNPFGFTIKGDTITLLRNVTIKFNNDKIPGVDAIIEHKKNALGFRGQNPPEEFEKYLKIICIGGSTTESYFITEGKTWPDLLAKKLTRIYNNIWLNNAGLDGHSSFGHTILIQDYIKQLHPDIALILLGGNDIERDNLTGVDKSLMISDNSIESNIKYLALYSESVSLLLNLYRYYRTNRQFLSHQALDLTKIKLADNRYTQEEILNSLQDFQPKVKNYEIRLRTLIETALQNNILPILITQPLLFYCGKETVTNIDLGNLLIDGALNGCGAWKLYELYNLTTLRVAQEMQVPAIDLASQFEHSILNFYDTSHYTNLGSEKVAEIIAPELEKVINQNFKNKVITLVD